VETANQYEKEDGELFHEVRKLIDGDESSYQRIYDLSEKYIYKIISDIVKNHQTTEDLMQETYLQIYNKIGTLQNPEAFYVWAGRIATNMTLRYIQKYRREVLINEEHEDGEDFFETVSDDTEAFIPEEVLMDKEKQRLIAEILDQLSIEQKLSVQYFYYEEMSVSEIAQTMGCSTGTVKSRLNYARKSIKNAVIDLDVREGTRLYSLAAAPLFLLVFRTGVAEVAGIAGVAAGAAAGAGIAGAAPAGIGAGAGAAGVAPAGAAGIADAAVSGSAVVSGSGAVTGGSAGAAINVAGAAGAGAAGAGTAGAGTAGATGSAATAASAATGAAGASAGSTVVSAIAVKVAIAVGAVVLAGGTVATVNAVQVQQAVVAEAPQEAESSEVQVAVATGEAQTDCSIPEILPEEVEEPEQTTEEPPKEEKADKEEKKTVTETPAKAAPVAASTAASSIVDTAALQATTEETVSDWMRITVKADGSCHGERLDTGETMDFASIDECNQYLAGQGVSTYKLTQNDIPDKSCEAEIVTITKKDTVTTYN
jgi:RNA polymerase sigma factor (sigma-70 family)